MPVGDAKIHTFNSKIFTLLVKTLQAKILRNFLEFSTSHRAEFHENLMIKITRYAIPNSELDDKNDGGFYSSS